MLVLEKEQRLCRALRDLPLHFNYRYTAEARRSLLELFFRSLVNDNPDWLGVLFNSRVPTENEEWFLRDAQGAVDGAEYTEAARGKPCGHIFKQGEATYRCQTCTLDDTCVLCSRCYESSDHTGHRIHISISPGNSGCCDCGDPEAWRLPVNCAIHSAQESDSSGKGKEAQIPSELEESIRMTIGRAFDYMCDVISCSPEQLRLPKSEASIREDERASRLQSHFYEGGDEDLEAPEFALVLWNDEKHAIEEVKNQVARACRETKFFGMEKARETDDIGRSVITYSTDLKELLDKAKIIEHIKITVTIRSARDTFREQMCSTIIEWLLDISGCSVGPDHDILKQTVCKEMLKGWRTGSRASNAFIGKDGIDDHEIDEAEQEREMIQGNRLARAIEAQADGNAVAITILQAAQGTPEEDDDTAEGTQNAESDDLMDMDMDMGSSDPDLDMRPNTEPEDDLEAQEATFAGYPPPPPPPPHQHPSVRMPRVSTARTSIGAGGESTQSTPRAVLHVPKTPYSHARGNNSRPPPQYWLEKPQEMSVEVPLSEDVTKRVRLDWMILFDLRLWKKARVDLRSLYISTVVTVPDFKRILGLRFAGLYTVLAQLYLIADREPDHSIIYLSLQMLTTASITQEIIERGNFLTNLIAILYTFLTARQVGHPSDVSTTAQLAFDAGSVTNRRMYHFFMDMKHLFQSEYVQERLRTDDQYVLQFLDLIKLPQGICPNVRAVGEHVEYETDAWISASILTRELNRLCRQFAEAFRWKLGEDVSSISRNIRTLARATIINSVGAERHRFRASEVKDEIRFKEEEGPKSEMLLPTETKTTDEATRGYVVVDFVVEKEAVSFHHALHYTLSWLIDGAKSMSAAQLRDLLEFSQKDLQDGYPQYKTNVPMCASEDYLIAMFDYPIRVCAWLAQMKAGMWVRNGLSLRHQMSTYRGVAPRDLAFQRDVFLIQTAMVTCDSTRILLSIVDRFGMNEWMRGHYRTREGFEEAQMLDVAEDLMHLLIVLISERTSLQPVEDEPFPQALAIRRDITHILCFKPLSFSELTNRLAEKFQELDEFQDILDEMTNFKAPEGLSDTGTFELKPEYLAEIDPYIAHYSKNQRDEAETVYKKWVSKKTGKPADEVVLEPKPRVIKSGLFKDLSAFTGTAMFAQIAYYSLHWALTTNGHSSKIPSTRLETFLLVVLHLLLLAVLEDHVDEESVQDLPSSFIYRMLWNSPTSDESIFMFLQNLLNREEFKSCHAKARLILLRAQQRHSQSYSRITLEQGLSMERLGTDSPATISVEDLEAKKKAAQSRQAKVMAQFQKQQQDFLNSQSTIDWGEEDFSDEDSVSMEEHKQLWKYPNGNCILCQEETNDSKLYGTFALISHSNILRQTDMRDSDWLQEIVDLPTSLDRSAEAIRPYGVGGRNKEQVRKITSGGMELISERQILGKGYKSSDCRPGTVSIGCGHIMHYNCFDVYCNATARRQTHQIARNHPERLDRKEFVCPLCKALGNTFMPIIWKGKEEGFPSVLQTTTTFHEWINSKLGLTASRINKQVRERGVIGARQQEIFANNVRGTLIAPSAVSQINRMSTDPGPTSPLRSSIANMPGIFPDDNDPSQPTVHDTFALEELMTIYGRIRDTIKHNQLHSQFPYDSPTHGEDIANTDVLAATLGYSISATEIAQRGVESEPGSILLDKISPLTLTHLRILAETAASYISIGGLRGNGKNRPSEEFYLTQSQQQLLLFGGHPQIYDQYPWTTAAYTKDVASKFTAALAHDPFVLLAEASVFLVPALQIEILHMSQLCYLMETVKAILTVQCKSDTWTQLPVPAQPAKLTDEAIASFRGFLRFLETYNDLHIPFSVLEDEVVIRLYTLITPYALAFLRKTAILLHVSYGVDFPSTGYSDMDEPELVRLTKALRLPSLPQMFDLLINTGTSGQSVGIHQNEQSILQQVVTGWISHWRAGLHEGGDSSHRALHGLRPSHPAIFELIGLPKLYDTLLDEVMRRRCPSTKKDLVEPAICLFCGEIFCSQAVCCSVDRLGGCNLHMKKCGQNIGLFINLRKCMVLYLHGNTNGSWAHAPYLDKHGEVDPGLRRSRQLFLNQKRYDALLRNVWLQHMIPTTISRKLEADINNGGWETL